MFSIFSLFIIFYSSSNTTREVLLEEIKDFENSSISSSAYVVQGLAEDSIEQKAEDVSKQISLALKHRHYININISELEKEEELKEIAVQPIGKTGYTAVHDTKGINHFHVNPQLVGYDLHNLAETLPEFWSILEKSLQGKASGYYDWEDADGVVRPKYMHCSPVEETNLVVCATTYIDEFYSPIMVLEEEISSSLDVTNERLNRTLEISFILQAIVFFILICGVVILFLYVNREITLPIEKLYGATRKLRRGDFKARTEIKTGDELEELSNTLNKAAEALERMDERRKEIEKAKTTFFSVTSHELRSPLTPMKSQLQMLHKGYFGKLNKKQRDSLEIILRNTDRLDNIIQDFLDISRIEGARLKFNFVRTDLTIHVKQLMEELKHFKPEKDMKLKLNVEKLPKIEVDPDRVIQVLRNLIENAIKYTHKKGKIEVSVVKRKEDILFSVKDDGLGISKEDQKRIFEPFFQVERTIYKKSTGVGLGLTVCRGIVESQNGKLWIESELGKGSTFYFTVPLKPVKKQKPIKFMFHSKEGKKGSFS